MTNSKIQNYVDENGELYHAAPARDYKVISIAQSEAYKAKIRQEKQIDGRKFVMAHNDPIREITKDLTLIEAGAVIKLLDYMKKGDGLLQVNAEPMKQKDIQTAIGRGKEMTSKILGRLEELDIINKVREGRRNVFKINQRFFSYGGAAGSFTKLLMVTLRERIADLKLNEVGMLFKVLPYFHYSRLCLCANPDEPLPADPNEEDLKKLQYFSREDLAQELDLDVKTIYEIVRTLKKKKLMISTETGGKVRYWIHPDVMYRQTYETEWADSVRDLFKAHA
ncbi:DUF7343 domain-containing protein [Metabacillus sp. Hm71]|uniref:helix-turn-helix transcriptional regulator n=1 Tax=Metabacillus sp. Hm71 TaxID=3450743 RepID=UPI003F4245C5